MTNRYFLAVCQDRPTDPDGLVYTVYFVNQTDREIAKLSYETGGFVTFDDELIQTDIVKKSLGRVPPMSFVEVEKDDEGAFDFMIFFNFELHFEDGEVEKESITINKYLSGGRKPYDVLPVLDKPGYVFTS